MKIHDVTTKRWGDKEIVPSPIGGEIVDIRIREGDEINDWKSAFMINKGKGSVEKILIESSGIVEKLCVKLGDKIVRGEVLVMIEDNEQ